jgi:hypothetical protein
MAIYITYDLTVTHFSWFKETFIDNPSLQLYAMTKGEHLKIYINRTKSNQTDDSLSERQRPVIEPEPMTPRFQHH